MTNKAQQGIIAFVPQLKAFGGPHSLYEAACHGIILLILWYVVIFEGFHSRYNLHYVSEGELNDYCTIQCTDNDW